MISIFTFLPANKPLIQYNHMDQVQNTAQGATSTKAFDTLMIPIL